MLAVSSKDMVIWVGFKLNQNFIARTLCVNRNKPEMHCNGKCFLAKKIAEAKERNASKEAPIPNPDEQKQIICFLPKVKALPDEWKVYFLKTGFAEVTFSNQLVFPDIFQPPKA